LSVRKGNRIQLKALQYLKDLGWETAKLEQKSKFSKSVDAFGLFDILAIKEFEKPLLIQVTTNRPHSHKDYSSFSFTFGNFFSICQYVWHDRKGWVVYFYEKRQIKKCDLR
jgi:hypothetical protein